MQVDFYVLAEGDTAARDNFGCRLTEKAWSQGLRVFLLTADAAAAQALDERLWTFRQGSFIPHALHDRADGEPVLIGERPPPQPMDLLINLGRELPTDWQQWSRLAEIVIQSPEVLAATRERFRTYRKAGVEPTVHNQ
jgi:DNA polymerase-3 subunit chi